MHVTTGILFCMVLVTLIVVSDIFLNVNICKMLTEPILALTSDTIFTAAVKQCVALIRFSLL